VLTLPLAHGAKALALLFVFIGGLSAATGMVIVETIALSTMVCNDLVMPGCCALIGFGERQPDLSGVLIGIRRLAIVLVLLLGYVYFRAAGEAYALVGIGLISFAAVAQFAPAMFGGMYWKQGTRAGALAGLLGGFGLAIYPAAAGLRQIRVDRQWFSRPQGLFGFELFKAQAYVRFDRVDEISHCLWWSLLANIGLAYVRCRCSRADAIEARQAEAFVDVFRHSWQLPIAAPGEAMLHSPKNWSGCWSVFSDRNAPVQQLRLYARVVVYRRLA
jgi:hypothetical protein